MYLISWLLGYRTQPEDLPAEWLIALDVQHKEEQDSPCPIKALIQEKTNKLTYSATPLSPEIRSSIFHQLISEEINGWKSGVSTIIKKRHLATVLQLNSNTKGTLSQRLDILRPQLKSIYDRQQKDLIRVDELAPDQLASMTLLASQDVLDSRSAIDLVTIWFRCLQSLVQTILGSNLTNIENNTLIVTLLPSIDKLVKLWDERVRINPRRLSIKDVKDKKERVQIVPDIEKMPELNQEEFRRRAELLKSLLSL